MYSDAITLSTLGVYDKLKFEGEGKGKIGKGTQSFYQWTSTICEAPCIQNQLPNAADRNKIKTEIEVNYPEKFLEHGPFTEDNTSIDKLWETRGSRATAADQNKTGQVDDARPLTPSRTLSLPPPPPPSKKPQEKEREEETKGEGHDAAEEENDPNNPRIESDDDDEGDANKFSINGKKPVDVARLTAKVFIEVVCVSKTLLVKFFNATLTHHQAQNVKEMSWLKCFYITISMHALEKISTSRLDLSDEELKLNPLDLKIGKASGCDERALKENTIGRYRKVVLRPHMFMQLCSMLTRLEVDAIDRNFKG